MPLAWSLFFNHISKFRSDGEHENLPNICITEFHVGSNSQRNAVEIGRQTTKGSGSGSGRDVSICDTEQEHMRSTTRKRKTQQNAPFDVAPPSRATTGRALTVKAKAQWSVRATALKRTKTKLKNGNHKTKNELVGRDERKLNGKTCLRLCNNNKTKKKAIKTTKANKLTHSSPTSRRLRTPQTSFCFWARAVSGTVFDVFASFAHQTSKFAVCPRTLSANGPSERSEAEPNNETTKTTKQSTNNSQRLQGRTKGTKTDRGLRTQKRQRSPAQSVEIQSENLARRLQSRTRRRKRRRTRRNRQTLTAHNKQHNEQ